MSNRSILHHNSPTMLYRGRPVGAQHVKVLGSCSHLMMTPWMRMYPRTFDPSTRAEEEEAWHSLILQQTGCGPKKEVGIECCSTAEVREPAGYGNWRGIGESCCSGCSCYRPSGRLGRSDPEDNSAG